MILEGEHVLTDDWPVFCGYCYVAVGGQFTEDGAVVISDIEGTAAELKYDIGAREIRRCEIVKREQMRKGKLVTPADTKAIRLDRKRMKTKEIEVARHKPDPRQRSFDFDRDGRDEEQEQRKEDPC